MTHQNAVLGFGASGAWAQPWFSKREAIRIIHHALDLGIRHFDSAGFYGNGEAELRLGEALRGRDDVFISVKTGTRNAGFAKKTKDFSQAAMREDLQASLKRLGRDHVDIFYLHGPGFKEVHESQDFMTSLKEEGLILKAGVCGTDKNLARSVAEGKTDAIMGVYNLFDQRHEDIFRQALAKNITTTAIAPLAQAFYRPGFFVPKGRADIWTITRFLVRDRARTRSIPEHVRARMAQFEGYSAAQMMLAFVASSSLCDIILTTSTKKHHLDASASVRKAGPSADQIAQLAEIAKEMKQSPDKTA